MLTRSQKKQKIEHSSLLRVFGCDPLQFRLLGQYLGVNDTTNLTLTCKSMQEVVKASSRSGPANLVWEERWKTKIGYSCIPRPRYLGASSDIVCAVSQIQMFMFHLTDTTTGTTTGSQRQSSFGVEISLLNDVWTERNNEFLPDTFWSGPTKLRVYVNTPKTRLEPDKKFFLCIPGYFTYLDPAGTGGDGRHVSPHNDYACNKQEKRLLRRIMRYIWICVNRIANWDHHDDDDGTTTYPSAEYMMQSLPEWMHAYFPDNLDLQEERADRKTKPEFTHHPAPDIQSWKKFVPDDHRLGTREYELDDLPWY